MYDRDDEGTVVEPEFVRGTSLLDTTVQSVNGDTLGEVADLVLVRETGDPELLILERGGLLGIGSRLIGLPMSATDLTSFRDTGVVRASPSPEQLDAYEDSLAADVPGDAQRSWKRQADRIYGNTITEVRELVNDPFGRDLDTADLRSLSGTIEDVRRETRLAGEYIVLTVDGSSRDWDVTCGPAWFVMNQSVTPSIGDRVDVRAFERMNDNYDLVAHTLTIDGRRLELRDRSGTPKWRLGEDTKQTKPAARSQGGRMLLSSLLGAPVHSGETATAEVDDVLIEVHSRTAPMLILTFDGRPDRVLPRTREVRFEPGPIVTTDYAPDKIAEAIEMPSELSSVEGARTLESIYAHFGNDVPEFRRKGIERWGETEQLAGWGSNGAISDAMNASASNVIEGTLDERMEKRPAPGIGSALALHIADDEDAQNTSVVYVGPLWYMRNQSLPASEGEEIRVRAQRVEIEGTSFLIAHEIEASGRTVRLWNERGNPAWDAVQDE